jgi:hypothetical protein
MCQEHEQADYLSARSVVHTYRSFGGDGRLNVGRYSSLFYDSAFIPCPSGALHQMELIDSARELVGRVLHAAELVALHQMELSVCLSVRLSTMLLHPLDSLPRRREDIKPKEPKRPALPLLSAYHKPSAAISTSTDPALGQLI